MLGVGQLNGRPAVFDLDGDALRTVSRKTPYRFAFAIRSSGSKLVGEGYLPRPLDVRYLATTFRAQGRRSQGSVLPHGPALHRYRKILLIRQAHARGPAFSI